MPITLGQIAQECGVSNATVSRILNRKPGFSVSEELRQKVLETAKRLGYQPNRFARSLITGKSDIISFVGGHGMGYQLYGSILYGIRRDLERSKYSLLIEDKLSLSRIAPDGLIVWNEEEKLFVEKENFTERGTSVVGFGDRYTDCDWLQAYVALDSRDAIREALEHLWDNGRREIGCVHLMGCEHWTNRMDPRHLIYDDIAVEFGFPTRCIEVPYKNLRSNTRKIVYDLAIKGELPGALFCFNDEIAIGTLVGLIDAGIKVPEQVSVLGFDGIEDTEYTPVPVSTIALPIQEGCAQSIKMITEMVEGGSTGEQITLHSKLIKRKSSE